MTANPETTPDYADPASSTTSLPKRAFAASEWSRGTGDLPRLAAMHAALKRAASASVAELDEVVCTRPIEMRPSPRLERYDNAHWTLTRVALADLAPWPRMTGIPDGWCRDTMLDLAARVRRHPATWESLGISALLKTKTSNWIRQVCDAIPLIAVPETALCPDSARARDLILDDGCHRALALAVMEPRADVMVLVGEPTATWGLSQRGRMPG